MNNLAKADIVAGALLAGAGLFIAIYAMTSYQLGSISNMGPGYFPAAIGVLLVICGVGVGVSASIRAGAVETLNVRPFILIVLGVAGFAATIDPFGLIVSVPIVVALSALSSRRSSWRTVSLLILTMTIAAILIFQVGLGVQVKIMDWPF